MTSYTKFQLLRSGFNANSSLFVADSKKLPKEISYLRGETVKFVKFLGKQVSVKFKNGKIFVPIDFVLGYKDKVVLSKPTKNDTCFVAHSRNPYFDIGAVFESTVYTCGNDLIFNTNDNKRIVIDDSWAYSLNEVAKPAKLEDLTSKFNLAPKQKIEIPTTIATVETVPVIEIVDTVQSLNLQVSKNDCNSIYHYTSNDLNGLAMFKDAVDKELSEIGVYFDIAGKSHPTLIACLKQNQLYIDIAYGQAVKDITSKLLEDKK